MFGESIDYHNKIIELIPEDYRTSGIGIYAHPRALTKRRAKGGRLFFDATWYKWFGLLGMPVSSKLRESDFVMLVGDDIYLASDSEIDSILKKGAVMDLRAAECLIERGYGKRIGISAINKIEKVFSGEWFTDDVINGEFRGVANSDYFYSTLIDKETAKEVTYLDGARILSYYINHRKEKVSDGVAAYENENGERFIILPYVDTVFTYFTNVNHKRRRQLINAFEWIAKKELPVACENEKMCVNINKFLNKNVITLFNLSSDDQKSVRLKYKPIGKLKVLTKKGKIKRVPSKYENGILTIKAFVHSADALVLIDEV